MAQTVSAIAVLGPGATGLTLGYRVLNLDGTVYSAFTTTGVAETSVLGTYRVADGVVVPDAGGYIVFGTAVTDYAEAGVDSGAQFAAAAAITAAALATQASVDVVDGIVDAILLDTGTDIPASIAALNDLSSAEAQAAAAAAITAADVATGAEVAALNDLSAADVWAYGTRTLTQTAAEVAAAVAGSTLTIHRGDTFTATLTGLGSLADYVSLDFTVKSKRSDDDDSAVVRIRLNATGLGDGLLRINAAEAGTPGNGSITIDDLAAGDVTLTLAADETEGLTPHVGYFYDIQMITATGVHTLTEGYCNVVADVTRLIV